MQLNNITKLKIGSCTENELMIIHLAFEIANTSINNDLGFIAALGKACRQFIIKNKVTEDAKNLNKPLKLLVRYCDVLLKRSSKNPEDDKLELLNQIMVVFKCIDDKDIFQRYYSRYLAKRLVNNASASEYAKESMISKSVQAYGVEYISKLQRIFQVSIALDLILIELIDY